MKFIHGCFAHTHTQTQLETDNIRPLAIFRCWLPHTPLHIYRWFLHNNSLFGRKKKKKKNRNKLRFLSILEYLYFMFVVISNMPSISIEWMRFIVSPAPVYCVSIELRSYQLRPTISLRRRTNTLTHTWKPVLFIIIIYLYVCFVICAVKCKTHFFVVVVVFVDKMLNISLSYCRRW